MSLMSPLRAAIRTVAAAALFVSTPAVASAQLITFTFSGMFGSGTLAGTAFTNKAITISATGDVSTRQSLAGGAVLAINHTAPATVTIQDVGTFSFLAGTNTNVNKNFGVVGFDVTGTGTVLNGQADLFKSWDMTTSIGPVSGTYFFTQWDGFLSQPGIAPVETTGGRLILTSASTPGAFSAQGASTVPEPSSLGLLALAAGLVAVNVGVRRRVNAA